MNQRGSLVVRVFAQCLGDPGSIPETKDFKWVVEAPFSNARYIKGSSTGKNLRCDITMRQHYKLVIIPSVKSRHRPDMT